MFVTIIWLYNLHIVNYEQHNDITFYVHHGILLNYGQIALSTLMANADSLSGPHGSRPTLLD